ncbi:MAG TPA: nuclear transport factor 2 family protein [Candidatus Binatia bacterium]|nr:nuclear transport factor 2 family protein [Candidatus Binatia bacterium]
MLTKEEAHRFAAEWIGAWNAHDLDRIIGHYDDAVELRSPIAAQMLGVPDGRVVGRESLRAYFARGLAAFPELRFDLKDVLWGTNSVVLYYANQRGSHTGEYMELSPGGKVVRVSANYGA